jgi:hypothetical protein
LSDDNQSAIHSASQGGVIGQHADSQQLQFLVGPATGTELNTLRDPPVPILCWKVEDVRFAFDSSFVTYNTDPLTNPSDPTSDPIATPFSNGDIRDELKVLASQLQQNPGCPLGVFGHADPVGPAVDPDGFNKALSGRRATAIYALLISGTQPQKAASLWQGIATNPNEHWGDKQAQIMQQATGLPAGTSISALIPKYLAALVPPEYLALQIGPSNFLAQGADSQGKGDYQGCSSFNPLIIFSQEEEDSFEPGANDQDQTAYDARNLANAPNRRVMVLIFKKGSKVDPNKWPCPSAYGDKSGCIKRFWSNGQTRRSNRLPDQDRQYSKTQDTFACRFYDRLLNSSPCYKVFWVVRLLYDGPEPLSQRAAYANLPYSVTGVDGTCKKFTGTTDGKGVLRIPVINDPATMTLTISGIEITLNGGDLEKVKVENGVEQRLTNLGFFDPDATESSSGEVSSGASGSQALSDAVTLFQKNNNLPVTDGTVDSKTRSSLKKSYGC